MTENLKQQYAQEARERWGSTDAWKQSQGKTPDAGQMEEIFRGFAALREQGPAHSDTQAQVRRWQQFISDNLYTCTDEILAGLGQMYVCDGRFQANLDKYGEGTARLMSDAIAIYCKK